MKLPHTETRVMAKTSAHLNERFRRQMETRIFFYAQNPNQIEDRLAELDEEWDIERILETNAAGASLLGILMAGRNRRWMILPFAVAAFLMQHAIQGWCPPVEVFRRIGVRTIKEINDERYALKTLRGDFNDMNMADIDNPAEKAQRALQTITFF